MYANRIPKQAPVYTPLVKENQHLQKRLRDQLHLEGEQTENEASSYIAHNNNIHRI